MGLKKKKLEKEWLEWLSDEKPSTEVQGAAQSVNHEQNRSSSPVGAPREHIQHNTVSEPIPEQKPAQKAPETKNISIDISFKKPDVTKLKAYLRKLPKPRPKQLKIGMVVLTALVVVVVGAHVVSSKKHKQAELQPIETAKPSYDTVLPDNKTEETSSGKLQYDPEKKVSSFTDEIELVPVTVSQQPLPDTFKTDPDGELKKLADKVSATDVINESNPKAYVGTSAKGPQTAVFVKNDLLVFIYSARKIDKSGWAEYITKLR